jgi:hypothetical protein
MKTCTAIYGVSAIMSPTSEKPVASTFGELVAAALRFSTWLARSVGKVAHG